MRLSRKSRAFTLLELLVVIGLSAALTLAFLVRPNGVGDAAALQAAEANVIAFLHAARLRALASGCDVRALIPLQDRRTLVAQQRQAADRWETLERLRLPEGTGILPHTSRSTNAQASSTALAGTLVQAATPSSDTEPHEAIVFSAHGTTGTSGVIAIRRWGAGQFDATVATRFVTISSYGVAVANDSP